MFNIDKILIFVQGTATLAFLQFFDGDFIPVVDIGIKTIVAGFTCYALYKQSKKKK